MSRALSTRRRVEDEAFARAASAFRLALAPGRPWVAVEADDNRRLLLALDPAGLVRTLGVSVDPQPGRFRLERARIALLLDELRPRLDRADLRARVRQGLGVAPQWMQLRLASRTERPWRVEVVFDEVADAARWLADVVRGSRAEPPPPPPRFRATGWKITRERCVLRSVAALGITETDSASSTAA